MNTKDMKDAIELLGELDQLPALLNALLTQTEFAVQELKPCVSKAADQATDLLSALKPTADKYFDAIDERNIQRIKKYRAENLSDDLAVALIINSKAAARKAVENRNKKAA